MRLSAETRLTIVAVFFPVAVCFGFFLLWWFG